MQVCRPTIYRESLINTSHTACLSRYLCCWNKTEYHEPSQLILLHILIGRFCTKRLPAKTQQHWISVSCSVLVEDCALIKYSRSYERSKHNMDGSEAVQNDLEEMTMETMY